ncbi:MAG: hypothetical protein E7157_00800 [Lactobacillales bacterium]|nr:hypothetical protein [Lactobacillales bacterium]
MKEENKKNEQMDIFKTGFVKPEEEVEKIDIEEEIEESETKEEINNDIKYNNIQMKEKANELINELENQDDERLQKQNKKRKKKNIVLVIGIIIELLIIGFLCYIKFFKETYTSSLTCTNTTENSNNKYSITTNVIYYFDKDKKVAKTQNSIIYIFNDKASYEEYKKEYVDTNIKDYSGIEQIDIFDDQNYAYENKTTYTYSKLKKNKNVTIKDGLMTVKVKGRKEPITIYIESYDSVIKTNEETGFICE